MVGWGFQPGDPFEGAGKNQSTDGIYHASESNLHPSCSLSDRELRLCPCSVYTKGPGSSRQDSWSTGSPELVRSWGCAEGVATSGAVQKGGVEDEEVEQVKKWSSCKDGKATPSTVPESTTST